MNVLACDAADCDAVTYPEHPFRGWYEIRRWTRDGAITVHACGLRHAIDVIADVSTNVPTVTAAGPIPSGQG